MLTPFDVVYNALVTELKNNNGFKTGNVIDYDKDSDPRKGGKQSADTPEVVVFLGDCGGNFTENSSTLKLTPVYKYLVSTGSYNAEVSHKLLFNVLRLNADWQTVLGPLQWKDKPFVRNSRLVSANLGQSNPSVNRNISGWAQVVAIEFDFHILRDDFLEGLV